jgi:hypothetical protein
MDALNGGVKLLKGGLEPSALSIESFFEKVDRRA